MGKSPTGVGKSPTWVSKSPTGVCAGAGVRAMPGTAALWGAKGEGSFRTHGETRRRATHF
eukprot:3438196-Pyramimonas_sp.AAC.2